MSTYVVLRDRQSVTWPFRGARESLMAAREFDPQARAFAPTQPIVEVEELSRKERAEVARDPEVVGLTPVMPTKLIEPVEEEDGSADAGSPDVAWGIEAVGADGSDRTGEGVVVAVLDTGIDSDHPAFAGVDIVEKDFSGSGDGDVQGHGTHCAGTVLGRDIDGKRIGVATGVSKALIGKVLGDDGGGSSEMIFQGIRWAADQGAHVISMSLGFDFPGLVKRLTESGWPVDLATSQALEAYRGNLRMFDALMAVVRAEEAFGAGSVLVAAAGNESKRQVDPDYEIAASLPAAAEGIVSVGAVAQANGKLEIAPFSNTFPRLCGPGVGVESAKIGGGTKVLSGTSMACPHVAGVAALWWEEVRATGLPARAETIIAKVLASARTDAFDAGLDPADRGVGLVTAP